MLIGVPGGTRGAAPGRDGADQRELKHDPHRLNGLNVCKGAVADKTVAAGHDLNCVGPLRVLTS